MSVDVPSLEEKIAELEKERVAAREVIDALYTASRGGGRGLSYYDCMKAFDKACRFYEKFGSQPAILDDNEGY